MNTLIDICKRSFFLNLFIVAIPLIAYMIHNGSSATVALVWYLLLSLVMPLLYLSHGGSTFGPEGRRIYRLFYVFGWALMQGLTYKCIFLGLDLSLLWSWPTFGRDIVFLLTMYAQVTAALCIGYLCSRMAGGRYE